MSYSGDAAEQVVRMTLEGAEVAARITGAGAKEIAIMLYSVLKDQNRTKGKTRLANMLRSGKELKVYAVKDKDLAKFCRAAKQYGVLYCVLKNRDATDGITDVMVRSTDSSKVDRIFERFELTSFDIASVRSEIEHAKKKVEEKEALEKEAPQRSAEDIFLDALMKNPNKEKTEAENPTQARTTELGQSVPFSDQRDQEKATKRSSPEKQERKSVREELKEIRAELEGKQKEQTKAPLEHIAPNTKKSKKRKER